MKGKTRIAPTPSGFLHLGNAFSFVKTYLLARQNNLKILLRVDDLDRRRYRQKYVAGLLETLKQLGLEYDEGPQSVDDFEQQWSQQRRMDIYHSYLENLLKGERVFACACSRKEVWQNSGDGVYPGTCLNQSLPLSAKNVAWRLKVSESKSLSVCTWEGQALACDFPRAMRYFVVRRKDGIPAYQLASMADDAYYNITHVVRGQDLWHSTLAQLALAQNLAASFQKIKFHHHPLLLSPAGKKLSKSQKAAPVLGMLKKDKPGVYVYLSKSLGFKHEYSSLAEMERAITSGVEVHF